MSSGNNRLLYPLPEFGKAAIMRNELRKDGRKATKQRRKRHLLRQRKIIKEDTSL